MSIISFCYAYTRMIYIFSLPLLQRFHHKRISQQIRDFLSREVIRLSVNFSCGLLLIGPLIHPHPISQKFHNFKQNDGFPRHAFITAAYISFVMRPCTFPIIEPSHKVYIFRIVYGLVFCPASEWTETHKVTLTILIGLQPNAKPNIIPMKCHPAHISFPSTKTAYQAHLATNVSATAACTTGLAKHSLTLLWSNWNMHSTSHSLIGPSTSPFIDLLQSFMVP